MTNKTCGECFYYQSIWEHEGVCTATSELRKTCDFTSGCAIGGIYFKPPLTNGDVIHQARDREFAEYFVYESGAMWASTLIVDKTFNTYEEAIKATEDYLNAPADCVGKDTNVLTEESEARDE